MNKAALVAGGLTLVVALSACGTGTGNGQVTGQNGSATLFGDAQDLVRAASAKTGQAKSSKFTLVESIGGQQITGQGEGSYDGPNTVLDMTMNVAGQAEEIRFVDKTMYIQLPAQARSMVSGGKPWGRVTADSAVGKAIGATLDKAEQNDPSKFLEQVQQAGTITKSEQATLDGQRVSHYWVDIDFAKAADKFSSAGLTADQLRKLTSQVKTIPMQLWLNSDQLPVQVSEDLSPIMKAAGAPASAQAMTMTMKYSDWGTAVSVQAPPADQVGDLKSAK